MKNGKLFVIRFESYYILSKIQDVIDCTSYRLSKLYDIVCIMILLPETKKKLRSIESMLL